MPLDVTATSGNASMRTIFSLLSARPRNEDDEEWGWDDEPKNGNGWDGDMELPAMGSPKKAAKNILPASKGMQLSSSEKKSKPLALGAKRLPPSKTKPQQLPVVRKLQQQLRSKPGRIIPKKGPPPAKKEDDIFESMGLATHPTFSHGASGKSAAVTSKPFSRLGAKPLPTTDDDDDLGSGAAWTDDSDLDDLLDD